MNIALLLLSFILSIPTVSAAKLNRFTTDYCSDFPDGIPGLDPEMWADCCYEHDVSYWMGGTYEEKKEADYKLNLCVTEKTGVTTLGKAMQLGVWVGGSANYDTPYRWGYGWDYQRPYRKLSAREKQVVEQELSNSCEISPHQRIILKVMKQKGLRYSGFQPL